MSININKFRSILCAIAFALVALFSIFRLLSFFHENIPLGLYFNISLLGSVVAILYLIFEISVWQSNFSVFLSRSSLISVAMFGFMALAIVLQNVFIDDLLDYQSRSALRQAFIIFFFAVTYFFLGSAIQHININKTSLLIPLILMGYLVFEIGSNLNDGLVLNFGLMAQNRSEEVKFDHLTIGEPAIILVLMALSISPESKKYLFFLVGSACLFALGGRMALFAYILSWFIYKILIKRSLLKIFLEISLFVVIIFFTYNFLLNDFDDKLVSRMIFADGFEQDSSSVERDEIFRGGVAALFDQMLIGDPTFIVRKYGSVGLYIHNILSAWQFYGLFFFFSLIFAIINVGWWVKSNISSLDAIVDEFSIRLFVFSVLSLLIGKSINFYLIWLSLGYWLGRMRLSRGILNSNLYKCMTRFNSKSVSL